MTPCGIGGASDLWCANGGVCENSPEVNGTICKCPSTHAGTNCETLVEPQDLGTTIAIIFGRRSAHRLSRKTVVEPQDLGTTVFLGGVL